MGSEDATFHQKACSVLSATPRRQTVVRKWAAEGVQPRPPAEGRPKTQVHAMGGGPLCGKRQTYVYGAERAVTERPDNLNQYLFSVSTQAISARFLGAFMRECL